MRSDGNKKSQNKCKSRKKKRFGLKDDPDNLLEVLFRVPNNGRVGGARNNKRSDDKCNSKSRSMCRGKSRGATVAILGGGSANKLIFAVMRILAKTATSKKSSHQAGWVKALIRSFGT